MCCEDSQIIPLPGVGLLVVSFQMYCPCVSCWSKEVLNIWSQCISDLITDFFTLKPYCIPLGDKKLLPLVGNLSLTNISLWDAFPIIRWLIPINNSSEQRRFYWTWTSLYTVAMASSCNKASAIHTTVICSLTGAEQDSNKKQRKSKRKWLGLGTGPERCQELTCTCWTFGPNSPCPVK